MALKSTTGFLLAAVVMVGCGAEPEVATTGDAPDCPTCRPFYTEDRSMAVERDAEIPTTEPEEAFTVLERAVLANVDISDVDDRDDRLFLTESGWISYWLDELHESEAPFVDFETEYAAAITYPEWASCPGKSFEVVDVESVEGVLQIESHEFSGGACLMVVVGVVIESVKFEKMPFDSYEFVHTSTSRWANQ